MTYFIKQTGTDTLVQTEALPGFTEIPESLVSQVFSLISANRQFRIQGDSLQVAPDNQPSHFHVWNFETNSWTDPRPEQAKVAYQWVVIRNERDALLQASDWTALPGVPMTPEKLQAWHGYRQALRDVTFQPDPFNILWPVKP